MSRACHAGVAIFHVKTAQIAHIPISKLFPYVQKWSCGWAVLCLRSMGDVCGGARCFKTSGVSSLQRAFIWPDSSWGRVWGKEFSSWGKTAAGSELSSVQRDVLGSVRALSTAIATSSISFEVVAGNAPTSRIALIEAQGIHLCNNLMHVLVHHVLLGGKMGKLLLCTLASIGRR